MTTTGGPEHSVAEPVTVEQLDGDDIVVVPDAPPARHRRRRAVLVGAVVAAVIAAGVGIAVAVTGDDEQSTVQSSAPARTEPTPAPSEPKGETPKPPKQPRAQNPPPVVAPETPVSSPPVAVVPPPPVEPQEPSDTLPPTSPTSVLQWSATPAALTIPAGGHKTLTVHVVNPSDGTVTLGNPLSCAPTLRGPNGKAVGYAVCVEMAQLMAPHDELTQKYTIYATDSGAAGGEALKPGAYTASIQDLFDVKVTITSA